MWHGNGYDCWIRTWIQVSLLVLLWINTWILFQNEVLECCTHSKYHDRKWCKVKWRVYVTKAKPHDIQACSCSLFWVTSKSVFYLGSLMHLLFLVILEVRGLYLHKHSMPLIRWGFLNMVNGHYLLPMSRASRFFWLI